MALDEPHYTEPDPNKRTPKDLWDERYAAPSFLFGKEPSPFIKDFVGTLKKGKALDVGMGEGRHSVFLAQSGFQVTGLDVSAKGVEKAKTLASERNVNFEAKVQNLDFYLVPLMGFDTIVMTYYRPLPRFFSEILRGLVAQGTFILEAFTTEHYKNNKNPILDFEECYKPNELIGHLKNFHILYYREIADGNTHLVQAIAKKTRA